MLIVSLIDMVHELPGVLVTQSKSMTIVVFRRHSSRARKHILRKVRKALSRESPATHQNSICLAAPGGFRTPDHIREMAKKLGPQFALIKYLCESPGIPDQTSKNPEGPFTHKSSERQFGPERVRRECALACLKYAKKHRITKLRAKELVEEDSFGSYTFNGIGTTQWPLNVDFLREYGVFGQASREFIHPDYCPSRTLYDDAPSFRFKRKFRLVGIEENPGPPKKYTNKRRKPNKKKQSLGKQMVSFTEPKYYDYLSFANAIGAGGTLFPLYGIPQGDSQSTRVGDFVEIRKQVMNYSLYCANSDITTTLRLILFRWIPSTGLVAPTVSSILQSASGANVLSHLNFQHSQNYVILMDKVFSFAGTSAAPTSKSAYARINWILPSGKNKAQDYDPGGATGTNFLWFLALSDSSLTPFPLLNFDYRVYFEDTIREKRLKLVN